MKEKNNAFFNKLNLLILTLIIFVIFSMIIGINLIIKKNENNKNQLNKNSYNNYDSKPAIKIINIYGIIEYQNMLSHILSELKIAKKNKNIKAIILRINSGGGTVGASQAIYNALIQFKTTTNKLIISIFGDIAASGAYYLAMASDKIFAQAGTLTGSIGVIMMGFTFEKLFNTLGIKQEITKSGKFKSISSSFGRNRLKSERNLLQNIINKDYKQFYQTVKKGRKGKIKNKILVKYTDGRVFNGETALKLGFIDYIGGLNEVINNIKKRFNYKEIKIIEKKENTFNKLIKLLTMHKSYKMNSFNQINDFLEYSKGLPLYFYSKGL